MHEVPYYLIRLLQDLAELIIMRVDLLLEPNWKFIFVKCMIKFFRHIVKVMQKNYRTKICGSRSSFITSTSFANIEKHLRDEIIAISKGKYTSRMKTKTLFK